MKLNQFIANLLTIVENNPELAELEVMTESLNNNIYNFVKKSPKLVFVGPQGFSYNIKQNPSVEEANAIIIN